MTTTATAPPAATTVALADVWANPPGLVGALAAVNHRTVGVRFLVTGFVFFLIGGVQALLLRTQLIHPGLEVLSPAAYNQLMTMHGTTMMFLFAVPILEGFGNYLVPLMIGTRDAPFPRLNAFGYWCYLFGGVILYASFLAGSVPDGGWFSYVPLSGPGFSPGANLDYWLLGITFVEISGIAAAIELIVGITKMRASGMALNRIPLFVWNVLVMAFMIVFAFPVLVAGSVLLEFDRKFGTHFYNVAAGGDPLLWQHLFWIFGHPEVYIMFLPAAGFISMIIPTFARRPIVGYTAVAVAAVATGFLSFGLWVHHMFATGLPQLGLSIFSAASLMIAIPSGVQVFAWIATIWYGHVRLTTPMLYAVGFIVLFVMGGITGVMVAVAPFDWQVHDSYFVVAHFHYVLIGGVVFPLLGAFAYWLPKITGRRQSERLGKTSFWLTFIGFSVTFFPMHIVGFLGMPRRVYTYLPEFGWDELNLIQTLGAYTLGLGAVVFVVDVLWSLKFGRPAGDNPWNASSLEWATASPPAPYNFRAIPTVYSRDPLWTQPAPERRAAAAEAEAVGEALAVPHAAQRELLGTSALDGRPAEIILGPRPTLWPLCAAGGVAVMVIGLLVNLPFNVAAFIGLGLLVFLGATIAWVWPRADERRITAAEATAVRGLPAAATGVRATGWWGMVWFIVVWAVFYATLGFSYAYLWLRAAAWPLDDLARPAVWLPAGATAVLLASLAPALWANRAASRGEGRGVRWGLATAGALGLLFLGLLALDFARQDFSRRTNAYGSLYFMIAGFAGAQVLVAVLLGALTQVWAWLGYVTARRRLAVQNTTLYWSYAVATWVVTFGLLHLSPHVVAGLR